MLHLLQVFIPCSCLYQYLPDTSWDGIFRTWAETSHFQSFMFPPTPTFQDTSAGRDWQNPGLQLCSRPWNQLQQLPKEGALHRHNQFHQPVPSRRSLDDLIPWDHGLHSPRLCRWLCRWCRRCRQRMRWHSQRRPVALRIWGTRMLSGAGRGQRWTSQEYPKSNSWGVHLTKFSAVLCSPAVDQQPPTGSFGGSNQMLCPRAAIFIDLQIFMVTSASLFIASPSTSHVVFGFAGSRMRSWSACWKSRLQRRSGRGRTHVPSAAAKETCRIRWLPCRVVVQRCSPSGRRSGHWDWGWLKGFMAQHWPRKCGDGREIRLPIDQFDRFWTWSSVAAGPKSQRGSTAEQASLHWSLGLQHLEDRVTWCHVKWQLFSNQFPHISPATGPQNDFEKRRGRRPWLGCGHFKPGDELKFSDTCGSLTQWNSSIICSPSKNGKVGQRGGVWGRYVSMVL